MRVTENAMQQASCVQDRYLLLLLLLLYSSTAIAAAATCYQHSYCCLWCLHVADNNKAQSGLASVRRQLIAILCGPFNVV